ncbi:MAG: acetyltransferase [Conexibacter sp.]|nr:acetyltransferase [Conexibacter sp.]
MPGELTFRRIDASDAEAFQRCAAIAFHTPCDSPQLERFRHLAEWDRTLAAFDGDELVGSSAAYSHKLSVPGGELPSAGITWIAVLPTHRRRGILTRMLDEQIAAARARGEPLAALWASEGAIYGRFGFGPAASRARFTVATGAGAPPREAHAGARPLRIRFHELAGARPLLGPLFERVRAQRPGMPTRTDDWWDRRVLTDAAAERDGATDKRLVVVHGDDGAADGYAIYRERGEEPAVTLELLELIAPADDAAAALWRFLCSVDLVARLDAPNRPLDDPLPLLFADLRRARVSELGDSLWVRLLDVRAALEGRAWAADARLTLALRDDRIAQNAGSWSVEIAGGAARVRPAPPGSAPDLSTDVRWLGAAYLGGTPLTRLVAGGLVEEHTSGAAERLDVALHVPRAPWAPEVF